MTFPHCNTNSKHYIIRLGKTAHWNEEFEIEADGCEEMVALILNNQPKRNEEEQRDLLVAKGNLKLPAISGLLDGKLCHVEISMTGDIKLAVTLRYIRYGVIAGYSTITFAQMLHIFTNDTICYKVS